MTPDRTMAVGVDLGGTKIQAVVLDDVGGVVRRHRRSTDASRGADAVIDDVVACIRDACLPDLSGFVVAVGIGVAGQVDRATGTVRYAPNLGWRDVPLVAHLEERLAQPVAVLNDVQAAAYGEYRFGSGRGVGDLVCLFVGTGVGGGVIAHGELLRGCTGSAAELGHMTIDRDGPVCRCANRGCLEAFAGGWAIAVRAREAARADGPAGATLKALAGGDLECITAETVADAARGGDPLARRIVAEAGEALGIGAASIVNAFNPCAVILGGGVIDGFPQFVEAVRAGIAQRALSWPGASVSVVTAALGSDAGGIGAAEWARRRPGTDQAVRADFRLTS